MIIKLKTGDSHLSGGVLRILTNRLTNVDYVLRIWPFQLVLFLLGFLLSSFLCNPLMQIIYIFHCTINVSTSH